MDRSFFSSVRRKRLMHAAGSALLMAGIAPVLTACSSSSPSLYMLAPVAGMQQPAPYGLRPVTDLPRVVEVRKATIPAALDRDRIVLSDSGYRLKMSGNDSWSEPLSSEISRTLQRDLASRLPGTSFFVQDDATSTTPDAYVDMTVIRFSGDGAGNAVLDVQAAVHRADGDVPPARRDIRLTAPVAGGTEALVSTLSTLLGQASDQIASDIRQLPPVKDEGR